MKAYAILDIAFILPAVGCTTTATVEFCPTVFAILFAIHVGKRKFLLHGNIKGILHNIAHFPFFFPNKLVAWINVSFRCHTNILIAAATAAQTFNGNTGTGLNLS